MQDAGSGAQGVEAVPARKGWSRLGSALARGRDGNAPDRIFRLVTSLFAALAILALGAMAWVMFKAAVPVRLPLRHWSM